MSNLIETVKSFASRFNWLNVPYAIIGGWAVPRYGLPRPTYGINFTIGIGREDLPRLYREVENAGYTAPGTVSRWLDRLHRRNATGQVPDLC